MDIMEIAEMRKAFSPSEDRYLHPHAEAMRLRGLWTSDRRVGRRGDAHKVDRLVAEVKELVDGNRDSIKALSLIRQGLFIDPRRHSLYALRGHIFSLEGKLDEAVHNYEAARRMIKFARKTAWTSEKPNYNRNLIDIYWKRSLRNHETGRLLEALSDYEQILVLKSYGVIVTKVQDKLLEALRTLDKYEAYRCEWTRFLNEADPSRVSALLTQHAEYKIFRQEMKSARHMLFEAIDLDADNARAHELLQVVYDTGHHLATFVVIWAVYGCYDKALMTIEKARDCDPYNPGYTLLKAIALRLSGRLLEAAEWLESVDKGFFKLLEPSRDKQGSIMGNLTIEQTRTQLIKQWHLLRYDIAVRFMIEGRYQDTLKILQSSKLLKLYAETHLLMGDCLLKLGEKDSALRMYLGCLEKSKELKSWESGSRSNILLLKRITDILNSKCNQAVEEKRPGDAIKIAEDVLRMLDDEVIDYSILGQNRGETLLCEARAHCQTAKALKNNAACRSAAEGLRLTRGLDDYQLYKVLFDDTSMEKVIDTFGTRKKLPKSLKLLMQYS